MNKQQVREAAAHLGLGEVDFQWRTAVNTGNPFEVGYVYVEGKKTLFVKPHYGCSDSFYQYTV